MNKKKTYTFVVNTENVNGYGYRILTAGIDTAQYERNPVVIYLHNRNLGWASGNEVIGKCVKLWKENNMLFAEIEFDEKEEFAKLIAGKVERGFIRMASLSADVIETSIATEHTAPGQTLETVTKCKLIEISIVDIGGNDDALKLSRNGAPANLNKIETKTETKNMSLKSIALSLALDASAEETAVLNKIQELKLAKETAELKAKEATDKLAEIETAEATDLVEKAVKLGLIPEALKTAQLGAFKSDFQGQRVALFKLIEDKEAENIKNTAGGVVKEIVLGAGKGSATAITEPSFDYLQKHNPIELRRIKSEEPDKYAELAKGYGAGVRHIETK